MVSANSTLAALCFQNPWAVTPLVHTTGNRAKILESNMVGVLVSCVFTQWGRPKLSEALVLVGERDTTVTINVLGTFQMAPASKKMGVGD